MTRIIIDAGHGGQSRAGSSSAYGSRGATGLLEKDVTLDIARHVVARLGRGAALTRSGDANLSLGARASHAARDGADVFVSIHANSGPPELAGAETWVHPEAGASSHALAGGIQRALDRLGGRSGGEEHSRRGPLAVLSPQALGRRTAACLVEVDYLSNPRGERRLGDPGERAAIGAAIAGAIHEHLGAPPGTAVSASARSDRGDAPIAEMASVSSTVAGLFNDVADFISDATDPLGYIFHRIVDTNKLAATRFHPPEAYYEKVRRYAASASWTDKLFLTGALSREPSFWRGGWILDIQSGASAMTLDRAVFFRGELTLSTFVHELVHVAQYASAGTTGFLVSYFGASAATIAARLVRGQPLDMMRSSPHENQAYELEARFETWHAANP